MKIILYSCYAEPEVLDKRSYLKQVRILDGTFRDSVDIIAPSIRFEVQSGDFNSFNFVVIPDFNKYYFVSSKTILRKNIETDGILVDVTLTEDVLTTYSDTIKNLTAYVSRQEFSTNRYLVDTPRPISPIPTVEYKELTGYKFPVGRYDESVSLNNISYCYVLTVAAKNTVYDTTITPNNIYSRSYIMKQSQVNIFAEKLLSGGSGGIDNLVSFLFSNPNEALINLILLPCDMRTQCGLIIPNKEANSIKIGNGEFLLPNIGYLLDEKNRYGYLFMGEFPLIWKYRNYLDCEPFSTYELYLPFYGFFTLDYKTLLAYQSISVSYIIDYITGLADILIEGVIVNTVSIKLIYKLQCQIGIKVCLTTSNASEKIRDTATLTTRVLSQLIDDRKSVFSDLLRDTDLAIGSLSDVYKGGFSSSEIIEWKHFSESRTDGYVYLNVKPYIKITRHKPLTMKNYEKLFGLPSTINDKISNLLGYTEVEKCHLENFTNITDEELSNIEEDIKNGFIINKAYGINSIIVIDRLGNTISYTNIDVILLDDNSNRITINYYGTDNQKERTFLNSDYDNSYCIKITATNSISVSKVTLNCPEVYFDNVSFTKNNNDLFIYFKITGTSTTNLDITISIT